MYNPFPQSLNWFILGFKVGNKINLIWGCGSVVGHMLSVCEALGSIPRMKKNDINMRRNVGKEF